ncbi:XrtA system polysaccharide chain length determinant [Azohydromonas australica]|uniref:XrtA system polysaccharide chain length determinant n=1 Tax=Azohydromonas australica TaxID=364039 RepID=UPI00146E40C5|nr:XrtA system polysaccharide chain length determinant [Azohydromonas australica]
MSAAADSVPEKIRSLVAAVQRRRWLALSVSCAVAPLLAIGISLVPNQYEATARVWVNTQSVLKPMMNALTYQPDMDQQVRMLARTLISRPNVQRLVEMPELGLADGDAERREATVSRLMTKINIVPTGNDNFYQISYRGDSPEHAQRLVKATVDLFVTSGASSKQRDSQDAEEFIEHQIQSYETKLAEAENRLKEFKIRNFGTSGVSAQDYFTRMSVLSEEVNRLRSELAAAEKSRDAYRNSLQLEATQQTAADMSPIVAEIDTRLQAQRKLLEELLQRFTDHHPDVINARRSVERLTTELHQRRDAEARTPQSVDGKGSINPVYQKLRLSLAESEAQVASLRSQLAAKQSTLDQARAVGDRMPQVEAELVQLNRDYDVIRKNYEQLVARREAAMLGAKLNETSQLAQFRIIEPAQAAGAPAFPSRLHLALIAVVLTLVTGIGTAIAVSILRPTVDSVAALARISRRPVLGMISMQSGPSVTSHQHAEALKFKAVAGALMLLQAGWVAWIALGQ